VSNNIAMLMRQLTRTGCIRCRVEKYCIAK